MSGNEVYQHVSTAAPDVLRKNSSRFRELEQEMGAEGARTQLANESARTAALLSGSGTAVGGAVAGKVAGKLGLESGYATATVGKELLTPAGLAKNLARESMEEAAQSPLEDIGEGYGRKRADNTIDPYANAGKSALLGAVAAVGQTGATSAMQGARNGVSLREAAPVSEADATAQPVQPQPSPAEYDPIAPNQQALLRRMGVEPDPVAEAATASVESVLGKGDPTAGLVASVMRGDALQPIHDIAAVRASTILPVGSNEGGLYEPQWLPDAAQGESANGLPMPKHGFDSQEKLLGNARLDARDADLMRAKEEAFARYEQEQQQAAARKPKELERVYQDSIVPAEIERADAGNQLNQALASASGEGVAVPNAMQLALQKAQKQGTTASLEENAQKLPTSIPSRSGESVVAQPQSTPQRATAQDSIAHTLADQAPNIADQAPNIADQAPNIDESAPNVSGEPALSMHQNERGQWLIKGDMAQHAQTIREALPGTKLVVSQQKGQALVQMPADKDTTKQGKDIRKALDHLVMSGEQLAQRDKQRADASERLKARNQQTMQIDHSQDDILQAVAKLGGIDTEQALSEWWRGQSETVGHYNAEVPGNLRRQGAFAFKRGGQPIDTVIRRLEGEGYLPEGATPNDLLDALENRSLHPAGMEERARREFEARQQEDAPGEFQQAYAEGSFADDFTKRELEEDTDYFELNRMQREAADAAAEAAKSAELDKLIDNAPVIASKSGPVTEEELDAIFGPQSRNTTAESPQADREPAAGRSMEGAESGTATAEAAPEEDGFDLAGYTESDLRREERAAEQQQREVERQRAAADKARQEEETRKEIRRRSEAAADTFVLGGNAEDNLTGQGGLFDAPVKTNNPDQKMITKSDGSGFATRDALRAAATTRGIEPDKLIAKLDGDGHWIGSVFTPDQTIDGIIADADRAGKLIGTSVRDLHVDDVRTVLMTAHSAKQLEAMAGYLSSYSPRAAAETVQGQLDTVRKWKGWATDESLYGGGLFDAPVETESQRLKRESDALRAKANDLIHANDHRSEDAGRALDDFNDRVIGPAEFAARLNRIEATPANDGKNSRFEQKIKIAADGVESLRASDVGRVLEQQQSPESLQALADYITQHRPDLRGTVQRDTAAIKEENGWTDSETESSSAQNTGYSSENTAETPQDAASSAETVAAIDALIAEGERRRDAGESPRMSREGLAYPPPAGDGDAMSAMNWLSDAERQQLHDLKQSLPSAASEREAAQARIKQKLERRRPSMNGGAIDSNEPKADYTDHYETDLFGNPLPNAGRKTRAAKPAQSGVHRNVHAAPALSGDTAAPAGDYRVRTLIGTEAQRTLGARSIQSIDDLAKATSYLYRSAVERFDAIVTDSSGKPLAVVGAFKGAVDQASVYKATLVGEAVRIPGAAHIWFSHNHPSGTASLSSADRALYAALADTFDGSGIQPMGLIAVAGSRYASMEDSNKPIPRSSESMALPVVERELVPARDDQPAITSPQSARDLANSLYKGSDYQPGMMLLNTQNQLAAWVPLPATAMGALRHSGGLNAIYRAISESNASAVILVHGGELSERISNVTMGQNIAAAVAKLDVRPLDIIDIRKPRSAAETGELIQSGPLYSKANDYTSTQGMSAKDLQAVIAKALPAHLRELVKVEQSRGNNAQQSAQSEDNDLVEADYDLSTKQITLYADAIPTPERALFVLDHELTHYGLDKKYGVGLSSILLEARNNPMIAKLAAEIAVDRKMTVNSVRQDIADALGVPVARVARSAAIHRLQVETANEALAELNAAIERNDFAYLQDRYGVAVPKMMRNDLRGRLSRLAASVKAWLAKLTGKQATDYSDKQVWDLLAGVRETVRNGENMAKSDGEWRNSGENMAKDWRENAGALRSTSDSAEPIPHSVVAERIASTFDEARSQAKAFQGKPITNSDTGMVATVSRNGLDKMLSGKAVGKSETPALHSLAVANLDSLFEHAILGWSKTDNAANSNLALVHRMFAVLQTETGPRLVKLTVKEHALADQGNKIYTVEAIELNEKSPAAQWVDATIKSDGLDPISTRSVGDVLTIAQAVQNGNSPQRLNSTAQKQPASAGFSLPEETKAQAAQREVQDNMNRWRQVLENVREQGGQVDEQNDVYGAEERFHGRAATRIEDFARDEVEPLMQRLADSGRSLQEVAQYLLAQHAEEANARVREIDDSRDTAFGMEDGEAQSILAKFAAMPDAAEFKRLANDFRRISEGTLSLYVKAGIVAPESAHAMRLAYQFYVPVKGGDEDQAARQGTGKGLSVNGKQKRRMGHDMRDEHVLENMLRDRLRAIVLAEKNNVGTYLLDLIERNPDPKLWTVDVLPKQKVLRDSVAYAVERDGQIIDSFTSMESAKQFIQTEAARSKVASTAFTVTKSHDPYVTMMAKPVMQDHEVQVYVQGQPVRIQLHDPILAGQYRRMGTEQMGRIIETGKSLNRWLSKVYTGYNPEFFVKNVVRDLSAGTINLTADQGAKVTAKALLHWPKAGAAMFHFALHGKAPTGEYGKALQRYRAAGGSTGAAYMGDLERQADTLNTLYENYSGAWAAVKDGKPGKAAKIATRKLLGGLAHWFEVWNQAGENAFRLATFMAMQESGKTVAESASMAKNVTVNFNRKGELTPQLGGLFLFFNPSIQGTARLWQSLAGKDTKHKKQAWALVGSMAGAALALAMMNRGDDGDEWEAIPDSVKDRNLIIPLGNKRKLTIPLPYGYSFFVSLANRLDAVMHGESAEKASIRLASSLFENFSPVGNPIGDDPKGENLISMLPTALKMVLQPAFGINDFGGPMRPEYNASQPDNEKMWRGTRGSLYDHAAQGIAALHGSPYENNWNDVSPETLKYWVKTLTGGTGAFMADSASLLNVLASGSTPDVSEVPFVRSAVRESTVKDMRAKFNELGKEAKGHVDAWKRAVDAGDDKAAGKYEQDGELMALGEMLSGYKEQASALRDLMAEEMKRDDLSLSEKRLKQKMYEKQEADVYSEFIKQFKH
jgi:DNA repair protein RadC